MFSTIQDDLDPVHILENVLNYISSNYGANLAHLIVGIALVEVKAEQWWKDSIFVKRPDGETADTLALEASPSVGGGSSPSQGTNLSCLCMCHASPSDGWLYGSCSYVPRCKCKSRDGEKADTADSKPAAIRREGSNPSPGTNLITCFDCSLILEYCECGMATHDND